MLSARHIFRLCKQSAQISLGRPSIFFSSNADDSNSKQPPKNEGSESESLDVLLNATYSRKSTKPASKKSEGTKINHARQESEHLMPKDGSVSGSKASKMGKRKINALPLKDLLENAQNRTKYAESQGKNHLEPDTSTARTVKVAIEKKQPNVTSTELLNRIRKIAQEVAGAAGPKSQEVAEDLIRNLANVSKTLEKPIDLNELTFEKDSQHGADQNLDLLRNKIVSEEQIYKITPGSHKMQHRRPMEFFEPRQERVRQFSISHDLDVSLYPRKNIGIFQHEVNENLRTKSCLLTYEKLEHREIHLSHSYAPRNWFEQCIQWTEEGKLWHFPINNEQGLEEGQTVSFTEHIFLEDHLEGWCPNFGPIRHFMELVCLGLSKNPYLSVEEKIENIMWYRDYFEQHKELLEAAGTLNSGVTKVPALEAQ